MTEELKYVKLSLTLVNEVNAVNKRITKVIGFSIPPGTYQEILCMAQEERKTKSELFRDMFDIYKKFRQTQRMQEEEWIRRVIAETKKEAAEYTPEREEKEYRELVKYGTGQAKKIGITSEEELERYLDEA